MAGSQSGQYLATVVDTAHYYKQIRQGGQMRISINNFEEDFKSSKSVCPLCLHVKQKVYTTAYTESHMEH